MKISMIKTSVLGAALSSLVACGGSGGSDTNGVVDPIGGGGSGSGTEETGALKVAGTEQVLLDAFTQALLDASDNRSVTNNSQDDTVTAEAAADSDSSGGTNYSGTYTLEANVDEYDIVKYDGDHIFVAKSFGYSCCFAVEPAVDDVAATSLPAPIAPPQGEFEAIRILSTDPTTASASYVTGIDMPTSDYVMGMYLQNDDLITLSSPQFFGYYGDIWLDYAPWQNQSTLFKMYDVSDVDNISQSHTVAIEGGFVESRRVGNDIIVITRHMPSFDQIDFYVTTDAQLESNEEQLDQLSVTDIVPSISIDGEVTDLFSAAECYVNNEPLEGDAGYYPVISSITRIPIDDPDSFESLCISEQTHGIYVSETAVYLTQMHGESWDLTRIHKFGIDSAFDYRGSIDLDGYVWTSGQSDFRINEYSDQLRVVTTEFTGDEEDWRDYTVYVVEESADDLSLSLVSQLPNDQNPQEIGKPGEALFGVRFFGERAYLVTFEQIDPLYVLDLSDSTSPFIAGELEIPGVSEFLHPVNDDLLLGLGTQGNGDWRLKLELFDVSDLSAPASLNTVVIGSEGEYSYSEAIYNRHAFTYLAGDTVDRISLPATVSGYDEGQYRYDHGLYLFEVDKSTDASTASLSEVGYLSADPEPDDATFYHSNSRSIIHDDAVYFITGAYVWSAPWATNNTQQGPF